MRLLSLGVERFGALVERTFDLDGRAFVLEGPNEAGKSSFHAAIETVLYGFQPATRDAHPYAGFGEDKRALRLIALVELADGRRLHVERRLGATATLRVAPEGTALEDAPTQRNVPLAELQAIPRPLFRAVYSLTANDVAEPDDRGVQELIDELLTGDRGLAHMRPIRELQRSVSEARARLWRADNRGEPRDRALRRELGDVRTAAREASERERELALDEERLDVARRSLAEAHTALADVEREYAEAALLADLVRLARQEAQLARVDLAGFGAEDGLAVLEDPARVTHAVADAARALAPPRERLGMPALRLSERETVLLERAPEIERLAVEEAEDNGDMRDEQRLVAEGRDAWMRAQDLAAGHAPALAAALAVRASSDEARPAAELPLEALRAAALAWRDSLAQHRGAADRAQRYAPLAIGGFALGVGLVGAALVQVAPAWVGAVGFASLSGAAWLQALHVGPALRRLDDARATPRGLAATVEPLGLVPAVLAAPESVLAALEDLDEAREAAKAAEDIARRKSAVSTIRTTRAERWRTLAALCGFDEDTLASLPGALRGALDDARAARAEVRRDEAERATARRALTTAEQRAKEELTRERRLHAALRRALPDVADPAAAHAELLRVGHERTELAAERRLLAKSPRYAELERDPRIRASTDDGAEPSWSSERQRARERHRDELRGRIEELRGLEGRLAERLSAQRGPSAAELRARELQLDSALTEARETHDRLALLERALVAGERAFRSAHQPDVLRTASECLARITGGRYDRIDYPDPERRELMVRSSALGAFVAVGPPLSRGVREQVHLCLRLGTLEHLDRGREALPLVLDEALVHWDPARRGALYPALRVLTARRQVILLSCQPEHAAEAALALDARLVPLGAPGP